MRRSVEESSPDSSADGSYATVVEVRHIVRDAAAEQLKRTLPNATGLTVAVADGHDNDDGLRAFSPPELPAPSSYRDLHQGSASSSNSSVCSEGTQIWVPPLSQQTAFQAVQPRAAASGSAAAAPNRRLLYRDSFQPLQTLPEASSRRVTVDVHCTAQDSADESSPHSSVIQSVSQSTSPITASVLTQNPVKISPNSMFSTGSSNNNNARFPINAASFAGGSALVGMLPFSHGHGHGHGHGNSFMNESSSSSAIAQFEIQPLPQLQFVNKLENNSILELRQVSTSSNGSNNTNMINADSGISNTSPETQSSTELFHPVNYHPSRHFAEGHRLRAFPNIPPSMLSSIPSSASGAIIQSTSPTDFLGAEQYQRAVTPSSSASGQQLDEGCQQPSSAVPFIVSGLSNTAAQSQAVLRRCPSLTSRIRAEANAAQRAPQSILKTNVSSMPAVQMQLAFKSTLFGMLSVAYCILLCVLGILFPLIEVVAARLETAVYERYYAVLYTFGICFLGYVYVYLLRERDVRRKVQKARLFLRSSLLTQRRQHSIRLRSATAQSAVDVEAIALQRLNESSKADRHCSGGDTSKHSHPLDGLLVRLTVVLLGLLCIIYDGLEFVHRLATDSNSFKQAGRNSSITNTTTVCAGLAFSARPLLQFCFVFVQLYFIFLNSKMRVQRYQALARFGLSHMLACNLCIWFLAFINEVTNDFSRLVTHSAGYNKQYSPCMLRRGMVGELLTRSSPYLYYCVVQYSLFAVAIIITMWRNVGLADEAASCWLTPSSSTTSENTIASRTSQERNSVHFFESPENQLEMQNLDPIGEFNRVQQSLQGPVHSAISMQQDGDSSSSSGMSDSDSESTLTTPINPLPPPISATSRPQTQSHPLLPLVVRNNVTPQTLHQSVHSPLIVEQSTSPSVTFSRCVSKPPSQQVLSVDCQGAHRGLFVGLFVLVITLVNIILFHVLTQRTEFVPLAFTVHCVFEISLHLLSIVAMIVGFYKMQDMLYLPATRSRCFVAPLSHSLFSNRLTALGQTGIIMLVCSNFIALSFAFEQRLVTFFTPTAVLPTYQTLVLFLCSNIASLLQSICQTVFIVTGLRRMSYKMLHKRERPGRDYVTFLILYNLSMYFVEMFQLQRLLLLTFTVNYYGILFWLVIVHISIPLVVFYRLQSTLCLIRIWKTAYRFKTTS